MPDKELNELMELEEGDMQDAETALNKIILSMEKRASNKLVIFYVHNKKWAKYISKTILNHGTIVSDYKGHMYRNGKKLKKKEYEKLLRESKPDEGEQLKFDI